VSPRDKLNPIRVPGCIIAVRACVADDYGSRFSSFAFAKASPVGKLVPFPHQALAEKKRAEEFLRMAGKERFGSET